MKKYVCEKLYRCTGNLTLLLMVAFLVGGVALVELLRLSSQYQESQISTLQGSKAQGLIQFDLVLLSQKFKIDGNIPPLWYPDPYPTLEELLYESNPSISVIQGDKKNSSLAILPVFALPHFIVDASKMAAVESLENSYILRGYQTAWVASGDPNTLKQEEMSSFISLPGSSWPQNRDTLTFQGLTKSKISFLKYETENSNPGLIKFLWVKIENSQRELASSSIAKLEVSPPPAPRCQINLASGIVEPLLPNTNVTLVLSADSLATSAVLSVDNFSNSTSIASNQKQSIKNLGSFVPYNNHIVVKVPENPYPGDGFEGSKRWRVQAKIFGVDNSLAPEECYADFKIKQVPAPICNLSANPKLPLKNESTTLTLKCENPVTSATINGQTVNYDQVKNQATLLYKKLSTDTLTVSAAAEGPGGRGTASAVLGAGCRFSDPDYEEIYNFAYGARMISWTPVTRSYLVGYKRVIYVKQYYTVPITYYYGRGSQKFTCTHNELCVSGTNNHTYSATLGPEWSVQMKYAPADSPSCLLTQVYFRPPNGGCFISGTKLTMADHSQKNINSIREGDLVWNPLLKKEVRVVKVTAGPEKIPLWSIKVANRILRVTEDHPFFTSQGWVRADSLKKGEALITGHSHVTIQSVEREKRPQSEDVWNIELNGKNENDHFIEANGIPTGDLWIQQKIKTGVSP